MNRIILIAGAAALLAFPAAAAPSQCKGLDQAACTAHTACGWRTALVKDETVLKSGEKSKRNVKAHCRMKTAKEAR